MRDDTVLTAAERREQRLIIDSLGVTPPFDTSSEARARVDFLANYLVTARARGYVLGISGGVDSCIAGRLCQLAVEQARAEGMEATFFAMRLPYHRQADEDDAERALAFVQPDERLRVDIGPPTDALIDRVADTKPQLGKRLEHVRGNVKARQRMTAHYALANALELLVVGTDHASEAVTGFFTKHGDGACDVLPLAGLTKRRVRALALTLGAEPAIREKTPTADLESDKPGIPDELVLGVSYEEIDDFLEGRPVTRPVFGTIATHYRRTAHKRAPAATPPVGTKYLVPNNRTSTIRAR